MGQYGVILSSRPTFDSYSVEFGNPEAKNVITFDELNDRFASYMKTLEGKPYVYDMNGPDSYDCSGAVCSGIRETANPNFGDYDADGLYNKFSYTPENAGRGSVIYFDWGKEGKIDHVVTQLNNTQMLHPSSSAGVIQIKPLKYLDSEGGFKYIRAIDWSKIFQN